MNSHRGLVIVLAGFLLLGVLYSLVTPIFEAGDELWHYPFVQSLATGHGLPIQDPNVKTLWEQEGGQPPLYYALSALATFWIDTRDLPDRLWRNPEAKIGIRWRLATRTWSCTQARKISHGKAQPLPSI